MSGLNFGYQFDAIGNRDTASLDGAAIGDYTANALNQYTEIAATPTVTPLHDEDGNLTQDGKWSYEWDAENRLTAMQSLANGPDSQRLEFGYDSQSRRIGKRVYASDGTACGTLEKTRRYIYDDWSLLDELDGNNALVRSYIWGLDLSGSLQGAGGVGGLLAEVDGNSVVE